MRGCGERPQRLGPVRHSAAQLSTKMPPDTEIFPFFFSRRRRRHRSSSEGIYSVAELMGVTQFPSPLPSISRFTAIFSAASRLKVIKTLDTHSSSTFLSRNTNQIKAFFFYSTKSHFFPLPSFSLPPSARPNSGLIYFSHVIPFVWGSSSGLDWRLWTMKHEGEGD